MQGRTPYDITLSDVANSLSDMEKWAADQDPNDHWHNPKKRLPAMANSIEEMADTLHLEPSMTVHFAAACHFLASPVADATPAEITRAETLFIWAATATALGARARFGNLEIGVQIWKDWFEALQEKVTQAQTSLEEIDEDSQEYKDAQRKLGRYNSMLQTASAEFDRLSLATATN